MSRWPVRPADVALGTVPAEAREEAERLLRSEPAFRAEVERLQGISVALRGLPVAAWAPDEPPALDPAVAFTLRPPRAAPGVAHLPGRLRARAAAWLAGRPGGAALVLRPVAAIALAAVMVAGGVAAGTELDDDRPAVGGTASVPSSAVSLQAVDGPGAQRAAVDLPERAGGAVALRVAGARPTRAGEHYELWLLDDADHLISVGTFRVGADGTARGRFSIGVDPAAYRYVDVSLERDDGDPRHSRRSVLRSAALS